MAGQDGHAAHHLEALQQLRQEPHRFSLFAALRLLERVDQTRPRLGEARRPADEWVRIEQPPHLTFAPSDVTTAQPASAAGCGSGSSVSGCSAPTGRCRPI